MRGLLNHIIKIELLSCIKDGLRLCLLFLSTDISWRSPGFHAVRTSCVIHI